MKMIDTERVQQIKDRLADRYTSAEICDLIEVPVEDIIEEYWDRILRNTRLFDDVFQDEEDE